MAARSRTPDPPAPAALRRVGAGRHVSGDDRFVVEQGSNGWLVTDTTRSNELGLPLIRGPFATLQAARAATVELREGPDPASDLAARIAAIPRGTTRVRAPGRVGAASARARHPRPPAIEVREYRARDGDGLRALWQAVGFRSVGDDDAGLRRFAQRNPGTFLVAVRGDTIIGSALGGWDGRRGWIHHLAINAAERRAGLATRLVRQLEASLQALGAPKVDVLVGDGNDEAGAFWETLGYESSAARPYGRVLDPDEPT